MLTLTQDQAKDLLKSHLPSTFNSVSRADIALGTSVTEFVSQYGAAAIPYLQYASDYNYGYVKFELGSNERAGAAATGTLIKSGFGSSFNYTVDQPTSPFSSFTVSSDGTEGFKLYIKGGGSFSYSKDSISSYSTEYEIDWNKFSASFGRDYYNNQLTGLSIQVGGSMGHSVNASIGVGVDQADVAINVREKLNDDFGTIERNKASNFYDDLAAKFPLMSINKQDFINRVELAQEFSNDGYWAALGNTVHQLIGSSGDGYSSSGLNEIVLSTYISDQHSVLGGSFTGNGYTVQNLIDDGLEESLIGKAAGFLTVAKSLIPVTAGDYNFSFADIDDPSKIYSLHSNESFSNSFDSLGYDFDLIDDFETDGWTALGVDNSGLDDWSFDLVDGAYTLFDNSTMLTLPTIPGWANNIWGMTGGSYVVNNDFSAWNNTLLTYQNFVSPLALDLDGDGIETVGLYDSNVFFDIDGDGFAEKVGWISADDGQLALDKNLDGVINDITELFGDDIMPAFQKLAMHDSNHDGVINNLDDDYDNLLVWRDLDQDGTSDAGELKSLEDAGIKEISLSETPVSITQNENYISGTSTFTRFDNTVDQIADVHFLNDNMNTWFLGARSEVYGSSYQVNPETLLLPLSRGYGSLASLHIAMTENADLLNAMKALVHIPATALGEFATRMDNFLFEWAGVIDNDPDARATGNGSNIDSRKVDFLEKFTGVAWEQMGVTSMVGDKASLGAKQVFGQAEAMFASRILVQGTLHADIFQNSKYEFSTDKITLNDSLEDLIDRATDYISATPDQAHEFWLLMAMILVQQRADLDVTIDDISEAIDDAYGQSLYIGEKTISSVDGDIYSAINSADQHLNVGVLVGDSLGDTIIGSSLNDYIFGGSGIDLLQGQAGDDFIRGGSGADVLKGGSGDDRLEGGDGDDRLEGGSGRDDVRGGAGIDTLLGGDGSDKLHGGAGADTLDGGNGSDELDYLESVSAVYVNLRTHEALGGDAQGDIFSNIENLTGSNNADVLIGDDNANYINGENGDDEIRGGDGDDILFGANGSDDLYGEGGNDILLGFSGIDRMNGGNGRDTASYEHPYNTQGVVLDLASGRGTFGAADGDTFVSIEDVVGTSHDDIIAGNNANNYLVGRDGNDILIGRDGDDVLDGGKGANVLSGGSGHDTYIITPDLGNFTRILDFDYINDRIDLSQFTSAYTNSSEISLAAIDNDTLISIDGKYNILLANVDPNDLNISNFLLASTNNPFTYVGIHSSVDAGLSQQGDEHGNNLMGTIFADTINGDDGNDYIIGYEGNDILNGDDGDDTLVGGRGEDILSGGNGFDTANYSDSFEGITVDLANGGTGGTADGDSYSSIESVIGSVFSDTLIGDNNNNSLSGGLGDDDLHVNGGNVVTLSGGAGNDKFVLHDPESYTSLGSVTAGLQYINQSTLTVTNVEPDRVIWIKDFDAGNPLEKIDLSDMTFDEAYITKSSLSITINGELLNGVAIHLVNGGSVQTILLQNVNYWDLMDDNFIMPSSSDIHWQVIGTDVNDILIGSPAGESIFVGQGANLVADDIGNDTIYGNPNAVDQFIIAKRAGDEDHIFNLNSLYVTYHWFAGGTFPDTIILGPNGNNIVTGLTATQLDKINLSAFADVRNISDLSIVSVDTNSDGINDKTTITLPGEQTIILDNFGQNWGTIQQQYGDYDAPEYGIEGIGWLLSVARAGLYADSFVFYDGNLAGTSAADILNGGYGIDVITGGSGDDVIFGASANDTLSGQSGNDVLEGGLGSDVLTGGDGADTFIINKEIGAAEVITDFEFWRRDEKIDLSAFNSIISDFGDVKARMTQQGSDTLISLGDGQTLILEDILIARVTADKFIGNASINAAPIANPDAFTVKEDFVLVNSVLTNHGSGADSDPEGATLSVVAGQISSEKGGIVTLSSDGYFTYTPAVDFHGSDTFLYTLLDGHGGIATGLATVNVTSANDDPVVTNASIQVNQDTSIVLNLFGNAFDADGDALEMLLAEDYEHGTVSINLDGTITYTPDSGFVGVDHFYFGVTDNDMTWGFAFIITGSVDVQVNPVNHAPVAKNDSLSVTENMTLAGSLLSDNGNGADSDIDGNSLTVLNSEFFTEHGNVVIYSNGNFAYTPDLNYTGADTFSYFVSDGHGGTSSAEATVAISAASGPPPTNSNPIAANDAISVSEDSVGSIRPLENDTDADADNLIITSIGSASHGTTVLNLDNSVTYTPNANYSGSDSFVYYVSDGNGGTASATTNINVVPVNDSPTLTNAGGSIAEDTLLTLTTAMLGATDVDNSSVQLVFKILSIPEHGSLFLDGSLSMSTGMTFSNADIASSRITYLANPNYFGSDNFRFSVSDGVSTISPNTFNISISSVNDVPDVLGDNITTSENTPITFDARANDSDADGDNLSVTIFSSPSHGTVIKNIDNTFTYTPTASYHGADSFRYTASDGHGGSITRNINISVLTANAAPVAEDDNFTVEHNTYVVGNVLADNGNGVDHDLEGNGLGITHATFNTDHGQVNIQANGDFYYRPDTGFVGTDSFDYNLMDYHGGNTTGHVDLNVIRTSNTNPDANEDFFFAILNQTILGNLIDNDYDADADSLEVIGDSFATANGGLVVITSNGNFTYTPDTDFQGEDTFSYELLDSEGGYKVGNAYILVLESNAPPIANDDYFVLQMNSPISANVLTNDSDADHQPLSTVAKTTTTTHGAVTIDAYGNFTYAPATGYSGVDSFDYSVTDGTGAYVTGTVHLNVVSSGSITTGTSADEALYGSSSADVIFGNGGYDQIFAGDGNDIIYTGNGIGATVYAGEGNDFIYGGTGADYIMAGNGNDSVFAGEGNDSVAGEYGADILDGGDGVDWLYLTSEGSGAIVDFISGTSSVGAQTDLIRSFENVFGTAYADVITTDNADNTIYGGNGNDTINSGGGADYIDGQNGADTINAGSDNDYIVGGSGDDVINGGEGYDIIYADDGDDILIGGTGVYGDQFNGGSGADIFQFSAGSLDNIIWLSQVRDFNASEGDKLDLSNLLEGFDPLTSAIADFVWIDDMTLSSKLYVDVDGGADNFQVVATLLDVTGVDADDLYGAGNILAVS